MRRHEYLSPEDRLPFRDRGRTASASIRDRPYLSALPEAPPLAPVPVRPREGEHEHRPQKEDDAGLEERYRVVGRQIDPLRRVVLERDFHPVVEVVDLIRVLEVLVRLRFRLRGLLGRRRRFGFGRVLGIRDGVVDRVVP